MADIRSRFRRSDTATIRSASGLLVVVAASVLATGWTTGRSARASERSGPSGSFAACANPAVGRAFDLTALGVAGVSAIPSVPAVANGLRDGDALVSSSGYRLAASHAGAVLTSEASRAEPGRVAASLRPEASLDSSRFRLGAEVQLYPAGVIPAIHGQYELTRNDVLTARVGWNFTDRQDYGEHDDETGGGPGLGVGYRRYFGDDLTGWMLGARVDLWFLDIDWEDDATASRPARKGSTDVIVLQPTVEGGYRFRLGRTLSLDLSVGLGFEINVHEDGDDVGEGGIALVGATILFGP